MKKHKRRKKNYLENQRIIKKFVLPKQILKIQK